MPHRYKDNRLRAFSALNNFMRNSHILEQMYEDSPSVWTGAKDPAQNVLLRLNAIENGSYTDSDGACAESLNRVMHKHLSYVGVAITPQNLYPMHSKQDSQGFACTRGGLNTILNTGNGVIRPGEKIKIDFALPDFSGNSRFLSPSHYSRGTPHEKVLVQTNVVKPIQSSDPFLHRVLDAMFRLKNPDTPDNTFYIPLSTVIRADDIIPVPGLHKTSQPQVLLLMPWSREKPKSTEHLDLDTVDASLMTSTQQQRAMNKTTTGSARLVRIHAESKADFENQAREFRNTIDDENENNYFCFHSRNITVQFDTNGVLENITGGVILINRKDDKFDAYTAGTPLSAADYHKFVLNASTGHKYRKTFIQDPISADVMKREEEKNNQQGLAEKFAYSRAVRVAGRSGDALHYALAVMKRHDFKNYVGAHTAMADFVRDTVKTALRVMQSENEQSIGVALSGANIGEPFDICLTDH